MRWPAINRVGAHLRVFVTRNWLGHRRRPKELRLCESLSLGERRFVGVIQYRQQRFLVGATNSNIAMLAQLPHENSEGGAE